MFDYRSIFVAGTDTGVGKTVVTGLLARFLQEKTRRVVTQKWVQTGGLYEDMDRHLAAMGKSRSDYDPYLSAMVPQHFPLPASPHLAAEQAQQELDVDRILVGFSALKSAFDTVVVEGSGGIMVPLRSDLLFLDLLQQLSMPIVVVSDNRLGTINQTLLTIEVLRMRRLDVLGVVMTRTSDDGDALILADNPKIIQEISGLPVWTLSHSDNLDHLYSELVAQWNSL